MSKFVYEENELKISDNCCEFCKNYKINNYNKCFPLECKNDNSIFCSKFKKVDVLIKNIIELKSENIEEVLTLFYSCFKDDHYYNDFFNKNNIQIQDMCNLFRSSIEYCINSGYSIGTIDNYNNLIGFALFFNYNEALLNNYKVFCDIFGADENGELSFYTELHTYIRKLNGETLYLLSIGVDPNLRRNGIASDMIDYILKKYNKYNIVSDVSNTNSLSMYSKRNFSIKKLDDAYHLVILKR